MVLGDFDGDGDRDIFVLIRNPNSRQAASSVLFVAPCAYRAQALAQQRRGSFLPTRRPNSPPGPPRAGRAARSRAGYDGDGDVDIVYPQYNAAPAFPAAANVMLLNNEAGSGGLRSPAT